MRWHGTTVKSSPHMTSTTVDIRPAYVRHMRAVDSGMACVQLPPYSQVYLWKMVPTFGTNSIPWTFVCCVNTRSLDWGYFITPRPLICCKLVKGWDKLTRFLSLNMISAPTTTKINIYFQNLSRGDGRYNNALYLHAWQHSRGWDCWDSWAPPRYFARVPTSS